MPAAIGRAYHTHWVTKQGQILHPEDMDTSHILNCLNMLLRLARKAYTERATALDRSSLSALQYASTAPDGAAMAAEAASDEMMEQARMYRILARDPQACRTLILKNFPIAKKLEEVYMKRTGL